MTIWDRVLAIVHAGTPEEDFRRWLGATAYASDSGDQITVWVLTEGIRRHLELHYQDTIDQALAELNRSGTHVRFVVGGSDEEDEDND